MRTFHKDGYAIAFTDIKAGDVLTEQLANGQESSYRVKYIKTSTPTEVNTALTAARVAWAECEVRCTAERAARKAARRARRAAKKAVKK